MKAAALAERVTPPRDLALLRPGRSARAPRRGFAEARITSLADSRAQAVRESGPGCGSGKRDPRSDPTGPRLRRASPVGRRALHGRDRHPRAPRDRRRVPRAGAGDDLARPPAPRPGDARDPRARGGRVSAPTRGRAGRGRAPAGGARARGRAARDRGRPCRRRARRGLDGLSPPADGRRARRARDRAALAVAQAGPPPLPPPCRAPRRGPARGVLARASRGDRDLRHAPPARRGRARRPRPAGGGCWGCGAPGVGGPPPPPPRRRRPPPPPPPGRTRR